MSILEGFLCAKGLVTLASMTLLIISGLFLTIEAIHNIDRNTRKK
jgi:hypothetical protein